MLMGKKVQIFTLSKYLKISRKKIRKWPRISLKFAENDLIVKKRQTWCKNRAAETRSLKVWKKKILGKKTEEQSINWRIPSADQHFV